MRMPRLLDKPYKLSLVCHLPLCWGSAELSVIALVWVMDWSPVHSASYLFLVLVPVTSYGKVVENVSPNCRLIPITPVFQYEYYQEGDIIIGGLVSAHDRTVEHKTVDGVAILYNICAFLDLDDYKAILAFIFAIEEINQDPDLLPNITLGYHIFDTCADPKKTLYYTFRILSGKEKDAPNYSCMAQGEVAAFVGDSGFPTTHAMAQLLNLYKYTQKPQSRCNDKCSPGYRKAPNGGYHVCCYDCVPCSEGEFSNITDSEICHKCPEGEWPDERNVKCVPKTYDFLSYEKDILVLIFSALTSLFSAVSLFILGSFVYYWDTPIVKANNRTVSFILLVSIFLSFLCVFLFLGRPMDITCLLRQMLFGIFFSISVSSVLGKTITVCIAFKATKPGSFWVKWVSLKVSNYVVVTCSSVQVLLCVMWLLVSPPYVEFDHHSYPGKIIIQCNEGSDLWFYSMLGYMGLLAAVSFLLAFMVRTLPDSFNEAKYITFSMLLFCSVWMAMIPAYLSTRGKSMVAVEIFAILTSCAGVLGCIFLPKLYIMILRPELNTRKIIIQK
ncbi:vomeronasal type-2 receptor 26-like [Leptodactylus fuscus]